MTVDTGWAERFRVSSPSREVWDSGVECGTKYYYRVRAHRHSDNVFSTYSNVASVTTGACRRYVYLPVVVRSNP